MTADPMRYRKRSESKTDREVVIHRILESYYGTAEGKLAASDAQTLADELRGGPQTVGQLALECGLSHKRTVAGLLTARSLKTVRAEIGGLPRWTRRATA